MDNNGVLELLTKARDIFREHGGAKQMLFNKKDNTVCAIGAVCATMGMTNTSSIESAYLNGHAQLLLNPVTGSLRSLNNSAWELYETAFVSYVNDVHGKDAVLTCFDHAIKSLENK